MTIYQITNEFLIETFDKKKCECELNETLINELFDRLNKGGSTNKIEPAERKEQIRRAFSDFFVECGKVAVFFKGARRVLVKIIPFKRHPLEDSYIEKVHSYLKSIEKDIESKNEDPNNVIKISEKHSTQIEHIFKGISIPIDIRKITKKALIKAFGLSEKDIVLFINKNIIIRRFCEKEPCERRFEGLPPEEIKKMVKTLYPDTDDMYTDIEIITSTLADTTLNFAKISNAFFETNYLKTVQRAIMTFMKKKLSQPEIIVTAVSNYILRNAFGFIHELLAEKLLELLETKNKNAEMFIRYYKGDISIENGRKYITGEIVDTTGQKWNASMIINFILQYKKERNSLKNRSAALKHLESENIEIKMKLPELKRVAAKMQKELKDAQKKSQQLTDRLQTNRNSLKEARKAALHSHKGAEKTAQDMEKETKLLSSDYQNIQNSNQELQLKYQALQKEVKIYEKREDFLIKQIEHDTKTMAQFKKNFEMLEKKYDLLLLAVSQVLMKKKQLI